MTTLCASFFSITGKKFKVTAFYVLLCPGVPEELLGSKFLFAFSVAYFGHLPFIHFFGRWRSLLAKTDYLQRSWSKCIHFISLSQWNMFLWLILHVRHCCNETNKDKKVNGHFNLFSRFWFVWVYFRSKQSKQYRKLYGENNAEAWVAKVFTDLKLYELHNWLWHLSFKWK